MNIRFYSRGSRATIARFNRGRSFQRSADEYLTMEVIDKLARAVERAMPLSKSHALVGVTPGQLRRWIVNGQRVLLYVEEKLEWPPSATVHDRLCYELVQRLDEAHSKAIEKYARRIHTEAQRNWKAAVWMLQRTADEYGDIKRSTKSVENEGGSGAAEPYAVVELPSNGRGSPLPPLVEPPAPRLDVEEPEPSDDEPEV